MFLSDESPNIEVLENGICVETVYDEHGNGDRYYIDMAKPKSRWKSVTTLTKWSNPGKIVSINAYRATKSEEEQVELAKKWEQQRELGKRVHKALEKNDTSYLTDKKDVAYFNSYQKYINNIVLNQVLKEEPSVWSDYINGVECGFGGTADGVHQVAYYNLLFDDGEVVSNDIRNSVIDYKNPGKNHLNHHPEYGLEYYLQLAANTAAINKKTSGKYGCKDSLLIVATQRTINVYYLDNEQLVFYWNWFKRFVYNYCSNKNMSYDARCEVWNQFADEAIDYYPYRLKIRELEHNEFTSYSSGDVVNE